MSSKAKSGNNAKTQKTVDEKDLSKALKEKALISSLPEKFPVFVESTAKEKVKKMRAKFAASRELQAQLAKAKAKREALEAQVPKPQGLGKVYYEISARYLMEETSGKKPIDHYSLWKKRLGKQEVERKLSYRSLRGAQILTFLQTPYNCKDNIGAFRVKAICQKEGSHERSKYIYYQKTYPTLKEVKEKVAKYNQPTKYFLHSYEIIDLEELDSDNDTEPEYVTPNRDRQKSCWYVSSESESDPNATVWDKIFTFGFLSSSSNSD